MHPSISAVIITIPEHLQYLDELIININQIKPNFDEIIIVASGCKAYKSTLIEKARQFKSEKVVLIINKLSPSGKNRNLGWKYAKGDIVTFLDGDDLYDIERNKKILKSFGEENIDLFLHSYTTAFPIINNAGNEKKLTLKNEHLVSFSKYNKILEILGLRSSTNLVLKNKLLEFPIAHGHITIKNNASSFKRFHQLKRARNEDGIFLRDALRQQKIFLITNEQLSYYRRLKIIKNPQNSNRLLNMINSFQISHEVVEIK